MEQLKIIPNFQNPIFKPMARQEQKDLLQTTARIDLIAQKIIGILTIKEDLHPHIKKPSRLFSGNLFRDCQKFC